MQSIKFFLLSFCFVSIFLSSCMRDQCTETREFVQYNPIYLKPHQFRIDIETQSSRELENPGKMYYYKDYLLINEKGLGIHFFDNKDKSNPEYVTFYKIPGNFDMAIRNDHLIADNVIDLITIDISNIFSPMIIDRIEDYKERYTYWEDDPNRLYHAYSVGSDVTQILDCSDLNFNNNIFWRGDVIFANAEFALDAGNVIAADQNSSNGSGSTGVGGSTARFTFAGQHFYAVDEYSLIAYSLENDIPVYQSKTNLGWGIETIFPYGDKLFIGSNAGMYIFSLENPTSPSQLSRFEHARACDPVVVEDKVAFVTLRSGRFCDGFNNQLDVIDITSLTSPRLIKSYPMVNPHGLSVHDNVLYLSEGTSGLKIIDVENPEKIKEIHWNKEISSTDVIYLGDGLLMSIGSDGFHQYDVSDPKNIIELSHIPVR